METPQPIQPAPKKYGGRKPLPDDKKRKRRVLWLTDAEWAKLEPIVKKIKGETK